MRLFFVPLFAIFTLVLSAQEHHYQTLLLDKNLTQNANAILRADELVIDLQADDNMTVRRKKVVTILNKMGNKFAGCFVGYDNGRKVKNIQAEIYDALGNRLERIKENKFKDVSAVDGGTLYSDSRYKYYSYSPTQYPYTVVFTYETQTKNTGEIRPMWSFLSDYELSTEHSRIQIDFSSPDLRPEIKELNLEGFSVIKKETSNSLVYEAKNIPALKEESMSPSFSDIAPCIKIRPVKFQYEGYQAHINDWNDLGKWMYTNLLADRDALSQTTIDKAKNLVEGVTDNLEKAKIIYKYVQDNTRYISVQVGIGGIQPISAIEVDRVKYGDCKGLSNYTKALLKAVDVEAFYAHVQAGSRKIDFDEDSPDLAQGNHVILAIPYKGEYYWIDCTSQTLPFGFIGDFTDGRKAFVIKPDGGEIVTTTSYIEKQNYQSTKGAYTLHEDGSISGDIAILTKGIQYDDRFGLEQRSKENIHKHYKAYWDNINNLHISSYDFQNEKDAIVFNEKLSVDAVNYASRSGDRMLFVGNTFNKVKYIPNRYRDRKLPFVIQRGFFDEDEISIYIPDGYDIEAIPENKEIFNDFGSYSCNYEKSDKKIILRRRFLVKHGKYQNTEYEAYRTFMKEVSKWDNSKIVLIKS